LEKFGVEMRVNWNISVDCSTGMVLIWGVEGVEGV